MADLLRKPFGSHGKVHEVTPQSAGWRFVGFSLYQLRQGEKAGEATGDREVILVVVEGKAMVQAAGQDWGILGDRMNVFEKTAPHCLYVPNGSNWEIMAETDCLVAVCSAPGKGGHAARRIGPDGISLTSRGKGTNTRHINNIAMENEDYCDSLLVTEVFTRPGIGHPIQATGTTKMIFRVSPISRKPTITASTRPRGLAFSACTPTTGSSTKPWQSKITTSS